MQRSGGCCCGMLGFVRGWGVSGKGKVGKEGGGFRVGFIFGVLGG